MNNESFWGGDNETPTIARFESLGGTSADTPNKQRNFPRISVRGAKGTAPGRGRMGESRTDDKGLATQ